MNLLDFDGFFNAYAKRPVLFDDGRILGAAFVASGLSKRDFVRQLDYMNEEGVSLQDKGEFLRAVMIKGQLPSWRFALKVCEALGIAPHALVRFTEGALHYPDFLVEAEVNYVENRIFNGLKIEQGSYDFFATIANNHEVLAKHLEKQFKMRRVELLEVMLSMAEKLKKPNFDDDQERPVQVWNAYYIDSIDYALHRGMFGAEVKVKAGEVGRTQKTLQLWVKEVNNTAQELAASGKETEFVRIYSHMVQQHGLAQAQSRVLSNPEMVLPMRTGWRSNAHILLQDNRRVRGTDVLDRFFKVFAQKAIAQDKYAETVRIDADAQDDLKSHKQWAKHPSTRRFLVLSAQRQLIAKVLGHAVGVVAPEDIKYQANSSGMSLK